MTLQRRGTPTLIRYPVNDNLTVVMPGRVLADGTETMTALDAGSLEGVIDGGAIPPTWGFEQREPFVLRSVATNIVEQCPDEP